MHGFNQLLIINPMLLRREYLALIASLLLIFIEVPVRIITLLLRTYVTNFVSSFPADVGQHNLSSDSATSGPKPFSTASHLKTRFGPDLSEGPYPIPSPLPQTSPKSVHCLAIRRRSMWFRQPMAISLASIVYPTEGVRRTMACSSMLVQDQSGNLSCTCIMGYS